MEGNSIVKDLIEANKELLKKIETIEEYNKKLQNDIAYQEEQKELYKEGYELEKEKNIKLSAKIEVYKENLSIIGKELYRR